MDNVTFIEVDGIGGKQIHAIIDHGNGEFTSMPKSTYDEMIANEAAPL
jgi:DNA uptake protein ComE-like DNA-binding protein